MESIPAKWRGPVSGLLQAGYPSGYLLAAILYGVAFSHVGWRGMFVIGAFPALLVLYVRRNVPESPAWQQRIRQQGHAEIWPVLKRNAGLAIYAVVMGIAGAIFEAVPREHLPPVNSAAWLDLHIVVSIATYGLATVAAVAGIAVLLQERALKQKRSSPLLQALPAVAEGERLFTSLLAAAEVVLGVGVLSGMATQYLLSGRLLVLDHKTLFSLLAFVVIGLLLWLNWSTGLRGRRASRFVLAAYLLLTLAYPGVKFVRDVLLS